MTIQDSNFESYKLSILNDITRLGDSLVKLQDVTMTLALSIEQLKATDKVRSAIWGASGGLITATLLVLIVKSIWGWGME